MISTDSNERLFNAVEDSEGNFIMVGGKEYYDTDELNAYLVKVSPYGDILYEMEYIFADSVCWFQEIYYFNDSIIIFGVKGPMYPGTSNSLWMLVLDENLDILRSATFDLSGYRILNISSIINNSNNYVICAYAKLAEETEILFYELTSNGDSLNLVILEMTSGQFPFDILEKSDNEGYKVFASGYFPSSPSVPGNIVHVDDSFNLIKVDSIPYGLHHQNTAKRLNDTSYLLTGKKILYNPIHRKTGIVKLDSSDSLLAVNHFGMGVDTISYPGVDSNVDFISQDNIYYGGLSNFIPGQWPWHTDPTWILLTNLDQDLNLNWEKYYGGDAYYHLWGFKATQDGGCIMLCTKYDHLIQYHEYDIFILKVDSNGLITSVDETPTISIEDIIVFPNPGRELINVRGLNSSGAFILYNITGAIIRSTKVSNTNLTISVKDIPAGIYFYRIVDNDVAIKSGKWVKR